MASFAWFSVIIEGMSITSAFDEKLTLIFFLCAFMLPFIVT